MSRFVIPYSNGIILFLILILLDKKASCSHSKIINILKASLLYIQLGAYGSLKD